MLTALTLCVNLKSWECYTRFNNPVEGDPFANNKCLIEWSELYATLYHTASELFYKYHNENEKACEHFFEMTN